jgi:hypothetical protein
VGTAAWPYWLGAAAGFAIVTLFAPAVLAPLNRLWMRLAIALSKVTTPVVMAVLFFGTVLPTGLVMRLLGKDPLRLKWDPKSVFLLIERSPPTGAGPGLEDVTELVKETYEETLFPNYDGSTRGRAWPPRPGAACSLGCLDEQLPDGALIMEAGCGTGQLSNFLGMS